MPPRCSSGPPTGARPTGSGGAIATGTGQLVVAGASHEICFTQADPNDLVAVDAAYRVKYGRYRSIVDHLLEPGPRLATLQLTRLMTIEQRSHDADPEIVAGLPGGRKRCPRDTDAPDLMLDENYTLTQTTGYRQSPRGMVDADQAR